MMQLALIFAIALVFMLAERLRPGRTLPNSRGWYARAAFLNGCQLGIVILAGLSWNLWFQHWSLFEMAGAIPPVAEGAMTWFLGTFVFYWWHRVRHASDFAWRVFHQIHHSATRIETLTSFYKHPVEIISTSIISSLIVFAFLGGTVEGAAWFNVFAATGEMFYHSNLRTPRWLGYFMQRPEHHSIHHEFGVHNYNFGDITWWDRLFGTFREAEDFAAACGFSTREEGRLGRMLAFVNAAPETESR